MEDLKRSLYRGQSSLIGRAEVLSQAEDLVLFQAKLQAGTSTARRNRSTLENTPIIIPAMIASSSSSSRATARRGWQRERM